MKEGRGRCPGCPGAFRGRCPRHTRPDKDARPGGPVPKKTLPVSSSLAHVISCHRLNGCTVPSKFKPPSAAPVRTPSRWSVACAAALHPGHDFCPMARCRPSLMAGDNDPLRKEERQKEVFFGPLREGESYERSSGSAKPAAGNDR